MYRLVWLVVAIFAFSINYSFAAWYSSVDGNKVAKVAENFLGKPYDPDPLGSYVRKKVIVYDEKVDCVYLVFRSIELALSTNESHSIEIALERRFRTRGILSNGVVINYEDRYVYMEDAIPTGKLGRDITKLLSKKISVTSSPRISKFEFIPKSEISKVEKKLRSGDIIFFVKAPKSRKVGEIVGHLGIVKVENGKVFLIHASGYKVRNYKRAGNVGKVVKEPLRKYLKRSGFLGIKVTRL